MGNIMQGMGQWGMGEWFLFSAAVSAHLCLVLVIGLYFRSAKTKDKSKERQTETHKLLMLANAETSASYMLDICNDMRKSIEFVEKTTEAVNQEINKINKNFMWETRVVGLSNHLRKLKRLSVEAEVQGLEYLQMSYSQPDEDLEGILEEKRKDLSRMARVPTYSE